MNTSFITCPVCGARIALPDYWTGTITCARCLNAIEPPMTRELPDGLPKPVIPLASQVRSDSSAAVILLVCLLCGLLLGVALLTSNDQASEGLGVIVVFLITLGLGFYVAWAITKRDERRNASPPVTSKVLEYEPRGRPRPRRRPPPVIREAIEIVKFSLGIIAGLGTVALLSHHNLPATVLILIPCAGVFCLFVRGWRSVGAGLLLSLPLGVIIFLCLCFGIVKQLGH